MSDNTSIRDTTDSSRINIHESYELDYWCDKFTCSKAELEAAVREVGVSVEAVRKHLQGATR